MWYRESEKQIEAGADDVLHGGLEIKDTIKETAAPYRWVYSTSSLPSSTSLLNFFRETAFQIIRRQPPETQISEYQALINFLDVVIRVYYYDIKMHHLIYQLYAAKAQAVQSMKALDPENSPLAYSALGQYGIMSTADSSYWISDRLKAGYSNYLALEMAGLPIHPSIKMALMLGLDVKSSSENDTEDRKKLINYIITKQPFYAHFYVSYDNDAELVDTLKKLVQENPDTIQEMLQSLTPEERKSYTVNNPSAFLRSTLFGCSIPSKDALRYYGVIAQTPVAPGNVTKGKVGADAVAVLTYRQLDDIIPQIAMYSKNFKKSDVCSQIEMCLTISSNPPKMSEQARDILLSSSLQPYVEELKKNINHDLSTYHTIMKHGLGSFAEIKRFLKENPEAIGEFMPQQNLYEYQQIAFEAQQKKEERKRKEVEKLNRARLKQAKEEIKRLKDEAKVLKVQKQQVSQQIAVSAEPATRAKLTQELEDISKTEIKIQQNHQELANEVDEITEIYRPSKPDKPKQEYTLIDALVLDDDIEYGTLSSIRNGQFMDIAQQIGASMHLDEEMVKRYADVIQVVINKTPNFEAFLRQNNMKSYNGLRTDVLGLFSSRFTPGASFFGAPTTPVVFLNDDAVRGQHSKMRLMKVLGIDYQVMSEAVIAHEIAHALNYLAMGGDMLHGEPTGNRGRDYITDYPEIVARVYGELPRWKGALFDQINKLKGSNLIKEAVMEETHDLLSTNEAWSTLGFVDPVHEYKRLEKLDHPYDRAENPLLAANKRVTRQREKIMNAIKDFGHRRRKEIMLNVLKEIREMKHNLLQAEAMDEQQGGLNSADKWQYQQALKKLEETKAQVLRGDFDYDLEQSIAAVAFQTAIRELKGMTDFVNDEKWNPPESILTTEGQEIKKAWSSGTAPMTYHELKTLAEYGEGWADGPQRGHTWYEPKMMEIDFAPHSPDYQEEMNPALQAWQQNKMLIDQSRFKRVKPKNQDKVEPSSEDDDFTSF